MSRHVQRVLRAIAGEIVSSSGPKHFDDYFVFDDEHALYPLCDAVS